MKCPEENCPSNEEGGASPEIIYLRYDDQNMKYVYLCGVCSLRIGFMGIAEFALPSLESLLQSKHEVKAVVSNSAKPMGRKRALKHTDVGSYALQNNIELIEEI